MIVERKLLTHQLFSIESLVLSYTLWTIWYVLGPSHCLYNYDKHDWAPHMYFAPGHYGRDGSYTDPYGYWLSDHMTIPKGYSDTGYSAHDYAVVTLSIENSNYFFPRFICYYIGYVGVSEVSGFDDAMLDSADKI
jgi:hypothetical protein